MNVEHPIASPKASRAHHPQARVTTSTLLRCAWVVACAAQLTACLQEREEDQTPLTREDRDLDVTLDATPDSSSSALDMAREARDMVHDAPRDASTRDNAAADLTEMGEAFDQGAATSPRGHLYVSGGQWGGTGFITRFDYDSTTPQLTRTTTHDVLAGQVLTYLAHSPRHDLLYSPDEADLTLHIFDVDRDHGTLTPHATLPTRCHGVHVMLDPAEEHLVMPCHREGETELFHLASREQITSTHLVSSGSRTHQACMSPERDRLFVVALEQQRLMRYRIADQTHRLEALEPPSLPVPGRIGPRHMAMHPNQRVGYVLGESRLVLQVARWDEEAMNLVMERSVSLEEDGASQPPTTGAAVRVHPSGRWLMSTQRPANGQDGKLVILALDEHGEPQGAPASFPRWAPDLVTCTSHPMGGSSP